MMIRVHARCGIPSHHRKPVGMRLPTISRNLQECHPYQRSIEAESVGVMPLELIFWGRLVMRCPRRTMRSGRSTWLILRGEAVTKGFADLYLEKRLYLSKRAQTIPHRNKKRPPKSRSLADTIGRGCVKTILGSRIGQKTRTTVALLVTRYVRTANESTLMHVLFLSEEFSHSLGQEPTWRNSRFLWIIRQQSRIVGQKLRLIRWLHRQHRGQQPTPSLRTSVGLGFRTKSGEPDVYSGLGRYQRDRRRAWSATCMMAYHPVLRLRQMRVASRSVFL